MPVVCTPCKDKPVPASISMIEECAVCGIAVWIRPPTWVEALANHETIMCTPCAAVQLRALAKQEAVTIVIEATGAAAEALGPERTAELMGQIVQRLVSTDVAPIEKVDEEEDGS